MPRLRDDPEKLLQTTQSIFCVHDSTWAHVQQLFETVFSADEKLKIWETNCRWAREAQGRSPWPGNDPGQDPNLPANRGMLQRERRGLSESFERL